MFERHQGTWQFVQTHASIGVANDAIGWELGGRKALRTASHISAVASSMIPSAGPKESRSSSALSCCCSSFVIATTIVTQPDCPSPEMKRPRMQVRTGTPRNTSLANCGVEDAAGRRLNNRVEILVIGQLPGDKLIETTPQTQPDNSVLYHGYKFKLDEK